MRKVLSVSAGVLLTGLVLVGCSTVPATSTVEPYSAPVGSMFDSVISEEFGPSVVAPATEVAEGFCAVLDSGVTYNDAVLVILQLGVENNVSARDLGFIVGAGVPAFCPQYSDAQTAWTNSH